MSRMKYWGDMVFSEPYKDKDGQDKKAYHKFGKIMENEDGSRSIYVPLFNKWFACYPKRDDQQQVTRNNVGQVYQQRNPTPTYTQPGNEPPPPTDEDLPF